MLKVYKSWCKSTYGMALIGNGSWDKWLIND